MRALLCALSLVIAVAAQAADPRVAELTQSANASIAEGNYEQATASLTAALEIADTLSDANARIETVFALARAYEQWAVADPARRDEHSRIALKTYSRLWLEEPRRTDAMAAARNNCAQIFATLGEDARAAELFAEATASDDPMRSFYLANFAEFLASRGQRDQAIAHYEMALALQPDDVVTEAKLLELYRDARVATHLWALVGRNELDRARSLALDQLSGELDEAVQRDLLGIVAVTLARQHVRLEKFEPFSARLGALIGSPSVRDGIRELRRLYDGAALDAASYSWWRKEDAQRTLPAMESPLAFSTLACELAEQIRKEWPAKAEQYFTLAIDVSNAHDPEPFISLAELYYSAGRKEDLQKFSDKYRDKMMEMKGAGYRSGNWRSVYRFHVALGTIYARLGWDGDGTDPRSAIYHFEHARSAARTLEVVLDPRSVDLLARSYSKVPAYSGKDLELRFDVAEEYVKTGRTTSAKRVLEPALADPRATQGQDKIRFEKLRTEVPLADTLPVDPAPKTELQTPSDVTLDQPTSDKIAKLLVEYFAAPEKQRSAVEEQLRGLGVTDIRRDAVVLRRNTDAVTIPLGVAAIERAPKRMEARLLSDLKRTNISARTLQMMLSDYYSAPQNSRGDLASKLRGFGVTKLNDPIGGKGSVVVRQDEKTFDIAFEVKPAN